LAIGRFTKADRKTANSLIMLVMRTLWLERNAKLFQPGGDHGTGHSPSVAGRVACVDAL
jgi:hypothetical protein